MKLGGIKMVQLMKKTIVALMLVLFIVSIVPLALADATADGYKYEDTPEALKTTQEVTVTSETDTATESTEALRERMMQAKESYEELKQQYMDQKQDYVSDKAKLEQLKEAAKECTQEGNCPVKKLELKRGVKQHLLKTLALVDQSLQRLTNQVEKSKVLTEEEKTTALAQIQDVETKLTAKIEEIKALNADSLTNEELQQQVKELKSLWQEIRKVQRSIITGLISGRHEKLTEVYAVSVQRAEAQISKLEAAGADATDIAKLKELLSAFELKVEEVKTAHKATRDAVLKAKTLQTAEAIDAAHVAQENVRTKMTEAKAALRELLTEMKQVRESLTPEAIPAQTEAVVVQ